MLDSNAVRDLRGKHCTVLGVDGQLLIAIFYLTGNKFKSILKSFLACRGFLFSE